MKIKYILISILTMAIISINVLQVTPISGGKFKNWESFMMQTEKR